MLEGLPFGPQLSAWIILFMLIVARLTFVIFLMPGIGDQTVPARVRVSLLLGAATWCGRQDRSVEEAHVIQYGALMPVMARTQAVLVERSWR